eukprot:g16938.t1
MNMPVIYITAVEVKSKGNANAGQSYPPLNAAVYKYPRRNDRYLIFRLFLRSGDHHPHHWKLRGALASEKQSKATAIEVLEEEMQAQRAVAQEATQQELHDGEERWSSELATQALREETAVRGLKEEVEVLKLQAQHWRLLEVAEKATKDQTEASLLSSQLAAGEQQVQLYRLRGEAEAQMVISRLEMSLEEGARHQKEAIELRAREHPASGRCGGW